MRRKSIKQNSGENPDDDGTEGIGRATFFDSKGDKRSTDEYKCGKLQCGKLYHSYTAFYNHCKKSHQGMFPSNSIYNGKTFQGPSKNRGRPRIKKTDAKDSIQIQSLKTENELIQFLGTLPKKKKNEQLIVYVSNPIQQLENAIDQMKQFKRQLAYSEFTDDLIQLNNIVSRNDLPDFYDPIQIGHFSDKMDSYNFLSIYNFLTDTTKDHIHNSPVRSIYLMRKIMIVWLTRILSVPLLAEVIYTVAQIHNQVEKIDEKDYLAGKTGKFKQLMEKYFECIINEQSSLKTLQNYKEDENE